MEIVFKVTNVAMYLSGLALICFGENEAIGKVGFDDPLEEREVDVKEGVTAVE